MDTTPFSMLSKLSGLVSVTTDDSMAFTLSLLCLSISSIKELGTSLLKSKPEVDMATFETDFDVTDFETNVLEPVDLINFGLLLDIVRVTIVFEPDGRCAIVAVCI